MKFLLPLIIVLLLVPIFVFAACPYPTGTPFFRCYGLVGEGPCGDVYEDNLLNPTPCQFRTCCYIVTAGHWLRVIGFALALVVVITAGILYMVSGGNETRVSSAKKTLLFGLVGTAIVIMAGYILATLAEFLH